MMRANRELIQKADLARLGEAGTPTFEFTIHCNADESFDSIVRRKLSKPIHATVGSSECSSRRGAPVARTLRQCPFREIDGS